MAAVKIGSPKLDLHTVIVYISQDPDGKLTIIPEFVIRPAPADGGIVSHREIGYCKIVVLSLDCRHLGVHGGTVEGGRHLADSPADFLCHFSVCISPGQKKTCFFRTLPNGLIVGERLARPHLKSVQLSRSQVDVVDAVVAAAPKVRRHITEQIPVHHRSQQLSGDFRTRDFNRNNNLVAELRLLPATVEGGYTLPVPLFINEGDVIRINTETGEYNDRTSTK